MRGISVLLLSRASRGLTCCFAEKVARDIEDRKLPPLFRMRLEVCLDEYLHRFFAGIHLEPKRRIAKIDFVPATVLSSDDRMRHDLPYPLPNHSRRLATYSRAARADNAEYSNAEPSSSTRTRSYRAARRPYGTGTRGRGTSST
jgi:hypothetical protein